MSGSPSYTPPGPSSGQQYQNPGPGPGPSNYYPHPPPGPPYPYHPGQQQYNPYQQQQQPQYPQQPQYYPPRYHPQHFPPGYNPYAGYNEEGYPQHDPYSPYGAPSYSPAQGNPYYPQHNGQHNGHALQASAAPYTPGAGPYSPAQPQRYPTPSWTPQHTMSPRLAHQQSQSPRMQNAPSPRMQSVPSPRLQSVPSPRTQQAQSPRIHQQSPRLDTTSEKEPRSAPTPPVSIPDPSESIPISHSPPPIQPPKAQDPIPPPSAFVFRSDDETKSSSPTAEWAIWSRHPRDPSQAPGIIISPRAGPPKNVSSRALELPTPPASPVRHHPVSELKSGAAITLPPHRTSGPQLAFGEVAAMTFGDVQIEKKSEPVVAPPAPPAPEPEPETVASPSKVDPQPEAIIPSSEPTSVTSSSTIPTEEPTTNGDVSSLSDVPSPAAPAVKKSWASMAASNTTKSSLPTSSIVGFSIPASATPAGLATEARRKDLAKLLNAPAPSAPSPSRGQKLRTRGLNNTGNMCFANAVLQALVYCPPFEILFRDLAKVIAAGDKYGTPLVDATIQFLKEFDPPTPVVVNGTPNGNGKGKGKEERVKEEDWPESFTPSYVYDAMKEKKRFSGMVGGHQEDAEEFLGFFLDTLEEELLSISAALSPSAKKEMAQVEEKEEQAPKDDEWLEVGKKKKTVVTRTIKTTESPITRIFGGKFRSTIRVLGQKDSSLVEDWRSLRLDIQRDGVHNIQDAISLIAQPQTVSMSSTIEGSQLVLIEALPPVLVLHIKRFEYDTNVKGVVKISKQVAFGPELEIPRELKAASIKAQTGRYKLIGVVYHHGATATGGHYTLDVLQTDGWVRVDDEFVSDVRPEDVFGALDREDRCAYLLFYKRV